MEKFSRNPIPLNSPNAPWQGLSDNQKKKGDTALGNALGQLDNGMRLELHSSSRWQSTLTRLPGFGSHEDHGNAKYVVVIELLVGCSESLRKFLKWPQDHPGEHSASNALEGLRAAAILLQARSYLFCTQPRFGAQAWLQLGDPDPRADGRKARLAGAVLEALIASGGIGLPRR